LEKTTIPALESLQMKNRVKTDIHTYIYNTDAAKNTELKKYLGAAFATVGTADELDVATAVLVVTTIPALESLQMKSRD
jgi:hypothetical protein